MLRFLLSDDTLTDTQGSDSPPNPILLAFLACVLTFIANILGAACVLLMAGISNRTLNLIMGVAVGLMLAVVCNDLVGAALHDAKAQGMGKFAWVPLLVGFIAAVLLLLLFDWIVHKFYDRMGANKPAFQEMETRGLADDEAALQNEETNAEETEARMRGARLFVFALAVHHLPESLACGVAFGGAGNDFGPAIALTVALGLQNIPEGMAASLTLRGLGMSKPRAFFWALTAGVVEPLGGILGALAVVGVESILPYALAFAGGAMLFVIVEDMIPDVMSNCHSRQIVSVCILAGFAAMTAASVLTGAVTGS